MKRKRNVLSDAEKGILVQYFQQLPNQVFDDWESAVTAVSEATDVELTAKNLESLRDSFNLSFTIGGDTGRSRQLDDIQRMCREILNIVKQW